MILLLKRERKSHRDTKEAYLVLSIERQKRSNPVARDIVATLKRQKRSLPGLKDKETEPKRQKSSDSVVRDIEATLKRQKRSLLSVKDREAESKTQKRRLPGIKDREAEPKRQKRNDPNMVEEVTGKYHSSKYGNTLQECLQILNENFLEGPVYVCTCCLQIWLRCSVHNIENINVSRADECNMLAKCVAGIVSKDGRVGIFKACQTAMCDVRVPIVSIYNKMRFVEQPPELHLYPMEERPVAHRIPLMQI